MWYQWKLFENMTKNLNHFLFWGPKWPANWASEANIQHTSKSSSNWHLYQDWCETRGNILSKWPKNRNCYLLTDPRWPKNGTTEAYIIHTSKSIREDFFLKNDKIPEFWLTFGPKMATKLGLWGPYSTHVKVNAMIMWDNTDVKPMRKWPKSRIVTYSKMA